MSRFILILIMVAAVFWLYRRLKRTHQHGSGRPGGTETHAVRCAECGLFLPEADAAIRNGRHFCQEHR